MYCNNCGAQNADGSVYCNKCGNRLAPTSVTSQQAAAGAVVRKTNGFAIAALILGFIGFLTPLCSIAAIVFGIIALNQIKNDTTIEGKGMAIAGLVCGSIILVLWLALIVVLVVFAVMDSSTSSDFWVSAPSALPALL